MSSRWIKIDTAITEHWIFTNAEYFNWWFDLLSMITWEERKVLHGNRVLTLKKGQIIASSNFLSERWNRSRPTIIKYLKLLEKEGMIKRGTLYGSIAIITICNCGSCEVVLDTSFDTSFDTSNNDVSSCKSDEYNECVCDEVYTSFDTSLYTSSEFKKEKKEEKKEKNQKKEEKEENKETTTLFEEMQKEVFPFSTEKNKTDKVNASQEVFRYFNETMANKAIPPIARMTERRKKMISARMREGYNLEDIFSMIKRASESDFLNGVNNKNWTANFDWLFLPNNFPKVLEGNYDNRLDNKQKAWDVNSEWR